MTPRPFNNIDTAQSLGRLEGGMEAMQASMQALTAAIDSDRAEAFRQREASAKRLAVLEDVVASIRADMDMVKPLAEKWRRWQYVGFGAVMTIGAIGSVIGAALQFFHDQVLSLLRMGN